MARQLYELNSLNFHQLIGAPLLAIVQAQAQAAKTTSEFIEEVGFIKENDENGKEKDDNLGQLRMVTFNYRKSDNSLFEVNVPLLSLIPIPSLEVKEADLEFFLKVNDVRDTKSSTVLKKPNVDINNWLSTKRIELIGSIGKYKSPTSPTSQKENMEIKLKIKLGQSDVPLGLSQLFLIMDQSIRNSQTEGVNDQ